MRILFLDLDTLRPDHLGCYGYHRNTSPNIDRIASEGVRFDNYYCSDAPCLPSRAALFTGRFGIDTGVVGHGGTAADLRLQGETRGFRAVDKGFVDTLRAQGLKTVSVSPFAERHGAWWFYSGFNEMHNTGKCGNESAENITPIVLDWIKNNASEDNWFLHINYWDAHGFYRAPEKFGNPFAGEPLPEWLTEEVVESHQQAVGPHCAREINMYDSNPRPEYPRHVPEVRNMQDLRKHIDGYDCGIAYMDSHIGMIFAALEKQGVMEDVAVIITSDHGENQGELGIYMEHGTADYATHRIPMIIRWPGCKKGHADAGLHYNLDLPPTLADLFGVEPFEKWQGESYAPVLQEGKDCARDYLVLGQCAHVCQRAVRWDRYQYIRTYHDGLRLHPREMLFDVVADPHEQTDLAPTRPDLCREAAHRLCEWHDDRMLAMADRCTVDPLWTVIHEGGPQHAKPKMQLEKYCKRLEETDRAWAAAELRKRHAV
jgi:arylsulfatase A-like enzyme